VLEIGGGRGGSAWAWQQLPSVQLVVTVTLPDRHRQWFCCTGDIEHRIIWGNSISMLTTDEVRLVLNGRLPDFLWIDGDHDYRIARADLDRYRPMCAPSAVIGLHDTTKIDNAIGLGVHKLWHELQSAERTLDLRDGLADVPGTGLIIPDTPTWKDITP
jgi:hypothetical protein